MDTLILYQAQCELKYLPKYIETETQVSEDICARMFLTRIAVAKTRNSYQ